MVLKRGMRLTAIGVVIGVAGSLALARWLGSLFPIQSADPSTYLAVAIVVAVAALAACYVPARRAMRVDPVVALRSE